MFLQPLRGSMLIPVNKVTWRWNTQRGKVYQLVDSEHHMQHITTKRKWENNFAKSAIISWLCTEYSKPTIWYVSISGHDVRDRAHLSARDTHDSRVGKQLDNSIVAMFDTSFSQRIGQMCSASMCKKEKKKRWRRSNATITQFVIIAVVTVVCVCVCVHIDFGI